MKLQEIMDVIQKRHANTSGNQIARLANRAMQDFCQKTEIYEESFPLTTTTDLRWQSIPDRVIKIKYIDVDGEEAPMVVGEPSKRDNT